MNYHLDENLQMPPLSRQRKAQQARRWRERMERAASLLRRRKAKADRRERDMLRKRRKDSRKRERRSIQQVWFKLLWIQSWQISLNGYESSEYDSLIPLTSLNVLINVVIKLHIYGACMVLALSPQFSTCIWNARSLSTSMQLMWCDDAETNGELCSFMKLTTILLALPILCLGWKNSGVMHEIAFYQSRWKTLSLTE